MVTRSALRIRAQRHLAGSAHTLLMRFFTLRRSRWPIPVLLVLGVIITLAAGATARGLTGHRTANASAPQGTSAAVTSRPIVGLSEGAAGWGGASTAPRLSRVIGVTRAKWMRDPFWWYAIEPRPGQFSFRYYDHYMLAAARQHERLVIQLVGTPAWAGPGGPFAVPANPNAYAAYVAAVLHRYGTGGTFWRQYPSLSASAVTTVELWNEPYFDNGNAGRYDPGRYARLVRAASIAARRVDPSARILMEAEMEPHHYNVWRWWVDSLYQAIPSLNRYFDGISVHDFGSDVTHLAPIVSGQPYGNFGRVRRIEDLRRQFIRHRAADKPFWIMETGWSTCTVHSIDCVTAAKQRSNLITLDGYLHSRWRSWVQAAFVYRFSDGPQSSQVQDGYGLIHRNGSAKPALSVFRAMASASG